MRIPCGRVLSSTTMLVATWSCVAGRSETPATLHVTRDSPPQAQLAARETNSQDVPRALIDDFDRVMTALEIRCVETRGGHPSLSDIAIGAVSAASQHGREITHLEALRTLEGSIHEGADMKIDCADAAKRMF